jgi:hypothetical protein
LQEGQSAAKPAQILSEFESMIAIAMIAVFLVVLAGLNRWEFGRFD